jgi:fluoroquinolone transport system ATP-binding protein
MISVQSLSYTYPKRNTPAISDVSFEIKEGEIFGFLGPSGAGKSTTQKVLNGLLKGYSGHVIVNGQDVASLTNRFYEDIGVAFEFPNLYLKLTALENLQMYASFYREDTEDPLKLLEMVGLLNDKDMRVESFSKGMKMRLNFIRSLLNKPKILFLDEPTSGLDPVNARRMKDIILDLKEKGTTIFLTTHNMNDADELCDRLAFMVDGKLPLIDYPENLKLRYGNKKLRVSYHQNGNSFTQEFDLKEIGSNTAFWNLLQNHEIETIHTQEATLEKIFIEVTGQKLI